MVRRLTEQEINEIYGGSIWQLGFETKTHYGPIDYVIEGEFDEPKVLGNAPEPPQPPENPAKRLLDRAMLAFRTFKEGRIGYDQLRFYTVQFCPWILPRLSYHYLYVPFGRYELTESEIMEFRAHAELVAALKEPAMEMACSRLADAETRLRPQDQIVDAVIGMESILLAGLGKDERRGELSYRFSLRYGTLFNQPEQKHQAYQLARDLYSLRSTIAHGSSLSGITHTVGDEKLSLEDAAKRATATLRCIVRHFLPLAKYAPYKKPDYWDRAIFGLPLATSSIAPEVFEKGKPAS